MKVPHGGTFFCASGFTFAVNIPAMTIFSKIIAGQIPSYKIAENERFFAFLDIAPLREGHTLIVPKLEVDKFFDMPADYLSSLLVFAAPIAQAIERAFDCNRCGLSVVGLEVPHAHLHLVPIDGADDLNFTRSKLKLSPEQFKAAQEKILKQLS
jgi:histidine triad (HIT) family protein